jgi:hypothetical protein
LKKDSYETKSASDSRSVIFSIRVAAAPQWSMPTRRELCSCAVRPSPADPISKRASNSATAAFLSAQAQWRVPSPALPVLAKLLALEEAVEDLTQRVAKPQDGIVFARQRVAGGFRKQAEYDDLSASLKQMVDEKPILERKLRAAQSVLSNCKAWVDTLPAGTPLEPETTRVHHPARWCDGMAARGAHAAGRADAGARSLAACFAELHHGTGQKPSAPSALVYEWRTTGPLSAAAARG